MKRDILEPSRYQYLSAQDSVLYDKVKDGVDDLSLEVKRLLEEKANTSRILHERSLH